MRSRQGEAKPLPVLQKSALVMEIAAWSPGAGAFGYNKFKKALKSPAEVVFGS